MRYNPLKNPTDLLFKDCCSSSLKVDSVSAVALFCEDLATLDRETFQVILLDKSTHLIRRTIISLGCVDSAYANPREVFKAAILSSASQIILVHNHPSGSQNPSADDLRGKEITIVPWLKLLHSHSNLFQGGFCGEEYFGVQWGFTRDGRTRFWTHR
jgi:DNA repair protein RadC